MPGLTTLDRMTATTRDNRDTSLVVIVLMDVGMNIDDPDAIWLAMDVPSSRTACRFVSGAFEVHNTTADMYKAGAVTVFRGGSNSGKYNASIAELAGLVADPLGPKQPLDPFSNGVLVDAGVNSLDGAHATFGSRTWEAGKGCYVPIFPDTNHTSYSRDTFYSVMACYAYQPISPGSDTKRMRCLHNSRSNSVGYRTALRSQVARIYASGAFFSGLSEQTTMTVDMRAVVEFGPTILTEEKNLARGSVPYDPTALAIVAEAVKRLPPGVPVDQNAFGDWWRAVKGVLSTVATRFVRAAPTLSKMVAVIPDRRAQLAAQALSAVGNIASGKANRMLDSSRQKAHLPKR